jgi:asparagine synthase (glutamine-hydrolysing)
MCGLAGRFHPVALPGAPDWAAQADARLAHRGPDGSGRYQDERCELVHRRLALIDLSPTGHQPMTSEDGEVWVVYNGEIYNHRALRAELEQRGHRFRGTSDTEVLVHLYEEAGEGMLERLRGIFAFAVYDRRRRRLLLARDRFGVKPLFYAHPGGQWVFASEIKAILALPGFHPTVDRQACYDFLGLGYVPEPATGFTGIAALPKGTALSVTPEGSRLSTWHRVEAQPDPRSRLPDAAAQLEHRLLQAVAGQSIADVPVAVLLSGGIDSSLVVAAHRRTTGSATTTFNVRFPDRAHDETPVARAVSTHCATNHHTIDPGEGALSADALLGLLRHFDQPFADASLVPMYLVSRAVRDRGIICALSGDGGDEAFGGYDRFWRADRLYALMGLPAWIRRAARAAGESLAGITRNWGRQVAKAAQFAEAGRRDSAPLLAGLSNYLTEDQKAELVVPEAREGLLEAARHFDGYASAGAPDLEELSRRMTEKLFDVGLPSDMLRKVDMMSMRASIEVRVPLLDEGVVALGLTLPHRLKTDGRTGKLVPRELARRWLPRKVVHHPKHGFHMPLDVMAPPALYGALEDLLLSPGASTRPVLHRELPRAWLAAFQAARNGARGGRISRAGLYQRIITLLSLELWLRDHRLTW